ncbi:MAG: hypothetical protein SGJ11_10505 [Phycisphaerae bacterium]|nr:hypothetical protein [Phycisphaerae bacterium]
MRHTSFRPARVRSSFRTIALVAMFVTLPLAAASAPQTAPPTKAETDRTSILLKLPAVNAAGFIGDPYPLDTCIVSGEKLGAESVTVILKDMPDALQEGRQIKLCCKACEAKLLANPTEYLRKLDAAIIAQQGASYPLTHCLVMLDETLVEDDHKTVVFGNRLYKLCCKKCVNNFLKGTGRYVGAFDREWTAKQKSKYPLDTCVVTGEKLGDKPVDLMIGYELVRVATNDAAKTVLENPKPYLAKLAAAKTAASKTN